MKRHEFKDRVDGLLVRQHIKGVGYNIKTTIDQRAENGNVLDMVVLVPMNEEEKSRNEEFITLCNGDRIKCTNLISWGTSLYKESFRMRIFEGDWIASPEAVARTINDLRL